MQATSEPSGGATQPTQQIRQHTDAGGGGIRQQTFALSGSSGGQRGRPCNPDEAGATLGGESGQSRWWGGSSVVTSNDYCPCHVAISDIAMELHDLHITVRILHSAPLAYRTVNRLASIVLYQCVIPRQNIIVSSTPIAIKICRSAYAIITLTVENLSLNFDVLILLFCSNISRKLSLLYFRPLVWQGMKIIFKQFGDKNHLETYIFHCFLSYYDHMSWKSHHHPNGTS